MSRRPDQLSVSRQHPADGASTYDGPGPVVMIRLTGAPTGLVPSIRCSLIHSGATDFERRRGTQRILLFLCWAGGAFSGNPKSTPPIAPCFPSTYGTRGFGPLNPPRIQTGSTP